MRRAERRLLVVVAVATGCTFGPGSWFATLRPSLEATYALRTDRDAGAGWQRSSSDYQVQVTALRMELGRIELLAGGGAAARFDPAQPPPGYSLCHNGHCHHQSGRLVPYAEIEAELAGGAGAPRAAVSLVPAGPLDLLAPAEQALACDPGCDLDRITLVRASVPVQGLVVEGRVRDGRAPARLAERAFRWQLDVRADGGAAANLPVLTAELELPADERHPPRVALRLRLALDARLFDGIEHASMAGPALEGAAAERLLQNLREGGFLNVTVSRDDP